MCMRSGVGPPLTVDPMMEGRGVLRGGGGREGRRGAWVTHLPGPAVGPHIFTSNHSGQVGQVRGEPTAESCENRNEGCAPRKQGPKPCHLQSPHSQAPKRTLLFLEGSQEVLESCPWLLFLGPSLQLPYNRRTVSSGDREVPPAVPPGDWERASGSQGSPPATRADSSRALIMVCAEESCRCGLGQGPGFMSGLIGQR